MRMTIKLAALAAAMTLAGAASAMTLQAAPVGPGRAAIADPDAGLERLAASSNPTGANHGKVSRSVRNVLRDDANLRKAFAWLDNK